LPLWASIRYVLHALPPSRPRPRYKTHPSPPPSLPPQLPLLPSFAFPHQGMGGTFFLPRLVPFQTASRLLLTGEVITGEEACRLGLVAESVPQVGREGGREGGRERPTPNIKDSRARRQALACSSPFLIPFYYFVPPFLPPSLSLPSHREGPSFAADPVPCCRHRSCFPCCRPEHPTNSPANARREGGRSGGGAVGKGVTARSRVAGH